MTNTLEREEEGTCLPATRKRVGVWTTWWRYEFLRARIAELTSEASDETCERALKRLVEPSIIAEELDFLIQALEANGIILHQATSTYRGKDDYEG